MFAVFTATVSQMLQRIVALAPIGVAVVDNHRDQIDADRAVHVHRLRDRLEAATPRSAVDRRTLRRGLM